MSRYIDADALKEKYTMVIKRYSGGIMERPAVLLETIDEAPSIDIVRCGECKLGGTEDCPMDEIYSENFCSYGERSEP